ncbi:hypothetical protein BDR04DRAFT_1143393 [Suillus decipiens]|nr:hypothetical protein BDR04DRAFT_1143393 [Suillus decipiens]
MPPHVVDVLAMRDREVLFVAPRPPPHRQNNQPTGNTIPDARPAHSLPVRLLALLVLFLCCAPPRHPNGNAQSTQQQQGQSQGLVQTQAALFQTQSATPLASTSTVPPAPGIRIMAMRAATSSTAGNSRVTLTLTINHLRLSPPPSSFAVIPSSHIGP